MWCYIVLLLAITISSSIAYPTGDYGSEDDNLVFIVVPEHKLAGYNLREAFPKDISTIKRGVPFNGGMYGKRSVPSFSAEMFEKRSQNEQQQPQIHTAQRRALIPFNGGMYGR